MMNHLQIKPKQGTRVQTWPQVVASGSLEVRPLPLSRNDRFFAMGSCFVNEIRHHLEKNEVAVFPRLRKDIQDLFPESLKAKPAWGAWDERVHYQNYTPFSVEQEIDVALGEFSFDDRAVLKRGADYWDPYRRAVHTSSPEQTLEIRRRMGEAVQEGLREANVAIMTLGSIESFLVKEFGGEVPEFRAAIMQDLEFREHTLQETEDCLTRICDKLLNRCGFEKIVLTVSPIPMGRTHRDQEVVLANCYSKAVLRVAVELVVRKFPNVFYFPSYEFVTTKGGFRTTDFLHVRSEIVAEITAAFLASFAGDEAKQAAE